jgi:hypothetical protein
MAREGKVKNEVRLGGWHTELSGWANINKTAFDFEKNGNFDNEDSVDFFWKHKIGRYSDVSISYHNVDNDGIINKSINIDGKTYAANAKLEIEMTSIDLIGYREIVSGPKGYLDFMYGIKFLDYDFDASGKDSITGAAVSSSESYDFPLPQFGFGGEYMFNEKLSFRGAFYGLSVHRDDDRGLVRTIDASLLYRFNPKAQRDVEKVDWSLMIGWKHQHVSGTDGGDEVTVEHEGAVFGLVGKF